MKVSSPHNANPIGPVGFASLALACASLPSLVGCSQEAPEAPQASKWDLRNVPQIRTAFLSDLKRDIGAAVLPGHSLRDPVFLRECILSSEGPLKSADGSIGVHLTQGETSHTAWMTQPEYSRIQHLAGSKIIIGPFLCSNVRGSLHLNSEPRWAEVLAFPDCGQEQISIPNIRTVNPVEMILTANQVSVGGVKLQRNYEIWNVDQLNNGGNHLVPPGHYLESKYLVGYIKFDGDIWERDHRNNIGEAYNWACYSIYPDREQQGAPVRLNLFFYRDYTLESLTTYAYLPYIDGTKLLIGPVNLHNEGGKMVVKSEEDEDGNRPLLFSFPVD